MDIEFSELAELIKDALQEFGCMTCHCERELMWSDFSDRRDIEKWLKVKVQMQRRLCPGCAGDQAVYKEIFGEECRCYEIKLRKGG